VPLSHGPVYAVAMGIEPVSDARERCKVNSAIKCYAFSCNFLWPKARVVPFAKKDEYGYKILIARRIRS
jgi:hypothetical protein